MPADEHDYDLKMLNQSIQTRPKAKGKSRAKPEGERMPRFIPKSAGRPSKFTEQQLAGALRQGHGILTDACRILQHHYGRTLHPYTLSKAIKRSERLQAVRREIDAVMLDYVVAAHWKKIEAGDLGAIHFYLRYKGADRGYTNNVQVSGDAENPIQSVQTINLDGINIDDLRLINRILSNAGTRAARGGPASGPSPDQLCPTAPDACEPFAV